MLVIMAALKQVSFLVIFTGLNILAYFLSYLSALPPKFPKHWYF